MSKPRVQLSKKLHNVAVFSVSYLQGRLVSLDVFRGIAIALMILINNPGGSACYRALQHAEWNGWTLADLDFPLFLFIVGVAIPHSFAKRLTRGDNKKKLFLRVVRRSVILFAIGLLVNGFPYFDLPTLRVMGVLQRIALCYFFASVIFLSFKVKGQLILTVLLPLLYWIFLMLIPVPGYGAGVLEKEGNLAQYVDNHILRGHLYLGGSWDPEGLLSTIPAIGTTLMGTLAGQFLRSNRSSLQKAVNLFFFGSLCIVIGGIWDLWFPINKNLWTSSYVAFTGGIALIFLAACYYLIDIKKYTVWTKPFVILGMNAIIIYVLSEIVNLAFIHTNVTLADGTSIALKTFIYENYFASWVGPLNGSLFYALAYLMLWLGITAILYKQRIFIKI